MVKYFCDICGGEIHDTGEEGVSRFKIKKEVYCWYESWWERLLVHDKCWKDLCELIKEKRR